MTRLQHRMLNYEVTPPAGVWNKISAELDEAGLEQHYPSRLYDYEVAPPSSIWEKINSTLDEKEKVILPERKRVIPFFKYAAAAAIIGMLAWGGIRFFTHNTVNKEKVANQTIIPVNSDSNSTIQNISPATQENTTSLNNNDTEEINATEQEARNDAALEASKKTYAKLDLPVNSKLKTVADFYFDANILPVGNTRGLDFDAPPSDEEDNNMADRYIMLMTPDGNIIRVSKKLGSLVSCVSGEEQDKSCTEQMKMWRQKVVNSSKGHSSGNFMDILSLVSSLQGYSD